jgi:formylglycine-generating enzyme required for sulfatase activity
MTTMNEAERFPTTFPPPFADAWGDDRYGLWVEVTIGEETQRFRWIEPGTFRMGSPDDEPHRSDNEGPQHPVTISRGFWLADTACTQALWLAVMSGKNPSHFTDNPNNPVEQVSWYDVQEFLRRVETLVPGCIAALPTEAQWEYACRAGTTTPFSFGEQITPELANYDGNYPYAGGEKREYRGSPAAVRSFPANAWGLYEMHGNVCEWCVDGLREYGEDPQEDPEGPGGKSVDRAVRGGSGYSLAWWARSADRNALEPAHAYHYVGFRLCLRSIESGEVGRAGLRPEGAAIDAGGP